MRGHQLLALPLKENAFQWNRTLRGLDHHLLPLHNFPPGCRITDLGMMGRRPTKFRIDEGRRMQRYCLTERIGIQAICEGMCIDNSNRFVVDIHSTPLPVTHLHRERREWYFGRTHLHIVTRSHPFGGEKSDKQNARQCCGTCESHGLLQWLR